MEVVFIFVILCMVIVHLEGYIHEADAVAVGLTSLRKIRGAGSAPLRESLDLLLTFDYEVFIHFLNNYSNLA